MRPVLLGGSVKRCVRTMTIDEYFMAVSEVAVYLLGNKQLNCGEDV